MKKGDLRNYFLASVGADKDGKIAKIADVKFGEHVCAGCKERQWSIADNRYYVRNGVCWSCDKRNWREGRLSLEEFERRETLSLQAL